MDNTKQTYCPAFNSIEDPILVRALNELGRSINLVTTYGKNHPAAKTALEGTTQAMQALFSNRKKITIGAFNGVMTIDETTINATGTLQKSLERRLVRLSITGLKIVRGISREELEKLTQLLASNDAEVFQTSLKNSGMDHIESENMRFQAVHTGETVTHESNLSGMDGGGVLVLDEETDETSSTKQGPSLHVEQIVAFLKGDIEAENGTVGEELGKVASDPDKLGRMIMESVSIRQSVSELSGESLNDIVLGCLRRTYDGLRKQPAFQSSEGKAELKKSLLLLEQSVLDKMRGLAGEENPELDRQIVQAMREMDENLSFEIAAAQYMEHREAIEQNKQDLHRFIQTQGTRVAEHLLEGSGFPGHDWRKIVIESEKNAHHETAALSAGLNTLATVFEKLEHLMKSKASDGTQVKDLLDQANDNLGDSIDNTKEKLDSLYHQLQVAKAGTIGGQGRKMEQRELLAALAEVAQELMQPLTAINASLEMMLHGYVGQISEEQHDLLTLASNSGEHLKFLMNMLVDIVGCPTNKGIDNRFHTTSDQVVLMKDTEGQEHLPLYFQ